MTSSKEFSWPEGMEPELQSWTSFWFKAKGDNITVSYSVDGGATFVEMGSAVLTSAFVWKHMMINQTGELHLAFSSCLIIPLVVFVIDINWSLIFC